jgi:hypothetical protein
MTPVQLHAHQTVVNFIYGQHDTCAADHVRRYQRRGCTAVGLPAPNSPSKRDAETDASRWQKGQLHRCRSTEKVGNSSHKTANRQSRSEIDPASGQKAQTKARD